MNILEIIGLLTLTLFGVVLILHVTGFFKITKIEIERTEDE